MNYIKIAGVTVTILFTLANFSMPNVHATELSSSADVPIEANLAEDMPVTNSSTITLEDITPSSSLIIKTYMLVPKIDSNGRITETYNLMNESTYAMAKGATLHEICIEHFPSEQSDENKIFYLQGKYIDTLSVDTYPCDIEIIFYVNKKHTDFSNVEITVTPIEIVSKQRKESSTSNLIDETIASNDAFIDADASLDNCDDENDFPTETTDKTEPKNENDSPAKAADKIEMKNEVNIDENKKNSSTNSHLDCLPVGDSSADADSDTTHDSSCSGE